MKWIVALIAFAPGAAVADKHLEKNGPWDCNRDPVVYIDNGDGKFTFTGQCKKIVVNGGENKLTIESVELLDVPGSENVITVGTIDALDVAGSDNTITWKKARAGDKPKVKGQLTKNKIAQAK